MIASGKQLRAARAMLGWSRESLAERAGVHAKTVSYWEAKSSNYRSSTIRASAPARMVAALQAAGIEIIAAPRLGIFLSGNEGCEGNDVPLRAE